MSVIMEYSEKRCKVDWVMVDSLHEGRLGV